MENPLLSIVIATRNREIYCIEVIKSILSIGYSQLEIAISDNSDSDMVAIFVKENPSKQIIYKYDPSPTSSIENFNKAIELARGKYLCLIGDDDTIMPILVDVVHWMDINNIDSVSPNCFVEYFWPDTIPEYSEGFLKIPLTKSGFITHVNARNQLNCFLSNGAIDYLKYSLPKIYHGIVRRSCMQEVKRITGHYFGGLSPDIYAATTLSLVIKSHFALDYPITIAGVCPKSTTAASAKGTHSGTYGQIPHLRNCEGYEWDTRIPRFYSVETIWAETSLTALSEMKHVDANDLAVFNYPRFVAKAMQRNTKIRKVIQSSIREQLSSYSFLDRKIIKLRIIRFLLSEKMYACFKTCYRMIFRNMGSTKNMNNIGNIGEAVQEVLRTQNGVISFKS